MAQVLAPLTTGSCRHLRWFAHSWEWKCSLWLEHILVNTILFNLVHFFFLLFLTSFIFVVCDFLPHCSCEYLLYSFAISSCSFSIFFCWISFVFSCSASCRFDLLLWCFSSLSLVFFSVMFWNSDLLFRCVGCLYLFEFSSLLDVVSWPWYSSSPSSFSSPVWWRYHRTERLLAWISDYCPQRRIFPRIWSCVLEAGERSCCVSVNWQGRYQFWRRCGCTHLESASGGRGLRDFGLQPKDVNDPQNSLILAKPVEEAFDFKRICFVYNGLTHKLVCRVLYPCLASTGWDGMCLNLPPHRWPFRRILSWHCICAIKNAVDLGWPSRMVWLSYRLSWIFWSAASNFWFAIMGRFGVLFSFDFFLIHSRGMLSDEDDEKSSYSDMQLSSSSVSSSASYSTSQMFSFPS